MSATDLRPVADPANWIGDDLDTNRDWLFTLSGDEVAGLKAMAVGIRPALNDDPDALLRMGAECFDLGVFGARLARVYQQLKGGLGVALIRGLPIDGLDPLAAATIYWGIGRHLGQATPNNGEGDMLGHVTDLGKTQQDANSRGYQTRELMDYHCDQSDMVGLLCVRTARSGGVSMLASSVAVFNALLRRHPDYAEALCRPLYWTKHGEHGAGDTPWYQSAVFNFTDGRLSTSFGPKHIEKGHRLPGVAPLSELQQKAIRAAEEIAHQQRYEMVLRAGDMQFVNNYVTLHTRSAYQDHADPARKRLLWRLWLMNPGLRARTAYSEQWRRGVAPGAGSARIRL